MALIELYRYQLLPITQQQFGIFDEPLTADQIRERKNEFFGRVLTSILEFSYNRTHIHHKLLFHSGPWFVFKISAHKSMLRTNHDFEDERIDDWPYVTVIINNDPAHQFIGVAPNVKAFASTATVVKIIERSVARPLHIFGLFVEIREQFDKRQFWDLMDEFHGRVLRIKFEMVSPNMANISKVLKIDLKQLNRDTNSHKTSLELEAGHEATLDVSAQNPLIEGCVEYSAMGGGDVAIKFKGLRKTVRTSTNIKTIEIDELALEGPNEMVLDQWLSVLDHD
ncbi:hypothetical protein P5W99_30005 [Paraburkholderia sp. A3BS-1L]|uniref:hypothetical protein n=1 Tax=Paraburkholderia sp. A3BS-1L TaxID=3028375 RepID=UPI003DA8640D